MALFKSAPVLMLCCATLANACDCMLVYGNPRMFVSAARRAPLTPLREIAPPVDTAYCDTILPTSNVLAPASETDREIPALGFTEFNKSAHRPPHPVKAG